MPPNVLQLISNGEGLSDNKQVRPTDQQLEYPFAMSVFDLRRISSPVRIIDAG
jgi:hypothetical protein